MAFVPLLAVVLLSCVSQIYAVNECDCDISSGVLNLTQVDSWVTQFSGLEAWLASASPDDEFGATESYSLSFNKSCGNTVLVYIKQTFSSGLVTQHTHALIKESDSTYYYEPGFALNLNFFACSADLVGAYKCKDGADGKTLFLILSPTTLSRSDIADQLVTCKDAILSVYTEAEFKDMYFPGTVPAKPVKSGVVSGLVKTVVGLVDDLL